MSINYSDTFDRSDGVLGSTDTGTPLAWTALSGTWAITSNKATTSTTRSDDPIAVVDPGNSQVEVSLDIGYGGDALYFRVVDDLNWWRIRSSAQTVSGVSVGSWSAWSAWSADLQGCGATTSASWTQGSYVSGYHTVERQYRGSSGPCSFQNAYRSRTRSLSYYNYTAYDLDLEKSVAGVVTNHGNSGSSSAKTKALCTGDNIQWYRWTGSIYSSLGTVNDGTHSAATQFGIGRGTSSLNNSSLDNFTLVALTPPTPTSVTPLPAAVANTDLPTLGATVTADSLGLLQKIQWQLATDPGFTANVRTITEPDGDLRASGPTTEIVPTGEALYQTTWYIRARSGFLGGGVFSPWTSSSSFSVSHPPAAASLTPTAGGSAAVTGGFALLSWVFTDTSPVDSQTAYEVEIQRTSDSLEVATSGKAVVGIPSATITLDPQYVGGTQL